MVLDGLKRKLGIKSKEEKEDEKLLGKIRDDVRQSEKNYDELRKIEKEIAVNSDNRDIENTRYGNFKEYRNKIIEIDNNNQKKFDTENQAKMRYSKPYDAIRKEELTAEDKITKKGILTPHKWERQTQIIARTLPNSKLSGIFSKNIVISPNEIAAIVKDGKIIEVVDSGKVKVGGLLKPDGYFKDVEVVLMDTSPKDSNWTVGELWTNDQHQISAFGLLRYRIADAQKFFSMIYAYGSYDTKGDRERFLTLEDINDRLKSEVLTRVLQPESREIGIEEVYGNRDFQIKVENELDLQLRDTLAMWGLELLKFTAEWDLGDYTDLLKDRREFEKREEKQELYTLGEEGTAERAGRVMVAKTRAIHAAMTEEDEFLRRQKVRDVETDIDITQKWSQSDMDEAKRGIETYKIWKQAKAEARRAEVGIDQGAADKEHTRDIERMKTVLEKGGPDSARVMAEGREYSRLSSDQIGGIAKTRESEMRAKEDKIGFMKEIEDRERSDAYRRQDLDAKLMAAAKPAASGATVKKCSHCGATVPMQASFCGECGEKLT